MSNVHPRTNRTISDNTDTKISGKLKAEILIHVNYMHITLNLLKSFHWKSLHFFKMPTKCRDGKRKRKKMWEKNANNVVWPWFKSLAKYRIWCQWKSTRRHPSTWAFLMQNFQLAFVRFTFCLKFICYSSVYIRFTSGSHSFIVCYIRYMSGISHLVNWFTGPQMNLERTSNGYKSK